MNIYILQMTALISNIDKFHSNLSEEIDNLRMRVEKCERQADDTASRLEICEKLGNSNFKEIKRLDKKVTAELSGYSVKVREKIPYVFSSPVRNRSFAGKTRETQELMHLACKGLNMLNSFTDLIFWCTRKMVNSVCSNVQSN